MSKNTLWRCRVRAPLLLTTALVVLDVTGAFATGKDATVADEAVRREAFRAAKLRYDVAPGQLGDALHKWAEASKLNLLVLSKDLRNRTTDGLSGVFTPQHALRRLLADSALKYELSGEQIIIYDPQSGSMVLAQATSLPTVLIEAERDREINPSSTMTVPPAYPGGQVARGGQVGVLGNRDVMNTPFSQNNYTAQVVQNQQARFLTEALNNDPSVVAAGSRTVGTDFFSIRGFGVSNSDVLFNGLQGIAPGGNDATVLAEPYERIEVLKGPSSLLNGIVGNVGGSINLVPKRAGDVPLMQFTPDYAMNSQGGGHVDVGRRFGDNNQFGARFNGVYRGGDTPINHLSRQTALASLGVDYRGERFRWDGDLGYQRAKVQGVRRFTRMGAGVQVPNAPDNRTNWFHPEEYTEADVYYRSTRAEFDVTDKITAFAALGGSESYQTRFSPNRTITSALGALAGGNFPGDASLTQYDAATWQTGVRGRLDTGFVQHQYVFAYSMFTRETRNSVASGAPATPFPVSNIYNPVYGVTPSPFVPSFSATRKVSDTTHSGFVVADTMSVLDERVQLTIGARQQQIRANNFTAATGVLTSSYDESATSPSAALLVKPWQNVSLYGSYIQGLQEGPVAPPGSANAGQVFAPFEAEQYETGVKVDFGRVATTLAFYEIALPNAYTNPTTLVFGIDGEQRHRGVDFNVFGEVAPGVRMLGGVAYIDSVLLNTAGGIDDGNRGIAVPMWRNVLGVEWDTPFIPGFTLTGRVIQNGSVFVDAANLQSLPAWTRLDLGARYRIDRPGGQAVVVRAGVDNVLNSNHWEATNNILILSEPRTFKISTSFDF